MTFQLSASAPHLELIGQVLGKPWVRLDARNVDALCRVAHKDLIHHVNTLPSQLQVAGPDVLDTHKTLQAGKPQVGVQAA